MNNYKRLSNLEDQVDQLSQGGRPTGVALFDIADNHKDKKDKKYYIDGAVLNYTQFKKLSEKWDMGFVFLPMKNYDKEEQLGGGITK